MPATESKLRRTLKYLSGTYVLLLAATTVARILLCLFQGTDQTQLGCYLQGSLITKVHCKGFTPAEFLEFIFDISSLMILAPLALASFFAWQNFALSAWLFLLFVLGLWLPVIYVLWPVKYGKSVLNAISLGLIAFSIMVMTGAI